MQESSVSSRRLLLVEDEVIIALSKKQIIEAHGFEVRTAHSGEDAIELATADSTIELVLMDIDLGRGIDGTEAAERILEKRDLPVVFLTSHSDKKYVDRVRNITSYGYVLKSAGEFVLIESIRMAFQLFEANQRAREREAQVRLERDRFRALSETSPVPIVMVDRTGTLTYANAEAQKTLGIERSQTPAFAFDDPHWKIADFHGNGFPREELPFAVVSRTHEAVYGVRHAITRPDGEVLYLSINATPIFDQQKRFDGMIAVTHDMTDQVRREEQLRESEQRYRELFGNAPIGIFQTRSDGTVVSVNPAMARMVGASTPEEAIRHFTDLGSQVYVRPERRYEFLRLLREHGEVIDFEYEARTMQGRHRVFLMNARTHSVETDGTFTIDGFTRDVTERTEAQKALEDREENLRVTLESIGDGIITTDLAGRVTRMNPSAEELTGFSTAEARGRLLNEVFHIVNSETLDPARDPVEHSIRSGAAVALENHTMLISRDGRRYQLADSAAPIRDRDRNMTGVVMVFRDFTEQYERSRELREARRFLEEVFDAIQDGISVVDKDMTITRVNAWMSERFGGRTPLTGKRCFEAYQRRMTTCPMCPVAETLSTGEVHEATKELTAEDGTVWWAHLFAYPMTDENGNVTGAIEHVRDITEQKHAQQRLEKALAEKDYLLKELNHRVKNNLNMVSSLVSLKDSALGEQVDLSDIRRRIDAIQIIHQKLHEDTDVSSIDLRDYVDELLDTLFSSFTAQAVEVSNRVASMSMAPPAAVPLGMIVTELAANAIEHGFDDTGPARFSVSMSGEDEHHVLTVSNTGAPFPEDIDLENPQTLGLQLVSALVSQLDGTIEVRRRPSPVFSIRIPSASLEARRANG